MSLPSETVKPKLADFATYVRPSLKGDEKGEAQIFLESYFHAFGHVGVKEAGPPWSIAPPRSPAAPGLELTADLVTANTKKLNNKVAVVVIDGETTLKTLVWLTGKCKLLRESSAAKTLSSPTSPPSKL